MAKITYVVGRYNKKIILPDMKLPKKIALFTTAQFISQYEDIKKQLEEKGHEVETLETRHTRFRGQIYGCSTLNLNYNGDAFLYIGDGTFHPFALLFNNEKDVYVYDPINKKSLKYAKDDIQKINKKRKAGIVKFYSSNKIGVLVSTKPGQNRMVIAEKLKDEFPEKDFIFFLAETLNPRELYNFPYIDVFVNTMCPRMIDDIDAPVVNLDDISKNKF